MMKHLLCRNLLLAVVSLLNVLCVLCGCSNTNDADLQKQIKYRFSEDIKNDVSVKYNFKGVGEGDSDTLYYLFDVTLTAKNNINIIVSGVGNISLSKGEIKKMNLYGLFHYSDSSKNWKLDKIFNTDSM